MSVASLLLVVALFSQTDQPVGLTVDEPAGVARQAWPVTSGIPLAEGAVRDPAGVSLVGPGGQAIPVPTEALVRWPDGSVRGC